MVSSCCRAIRPWLSWWINTLVLSSMVVFLVDHFSCAHKRLAGILSILASLLSFHWSLSAGYYTVGRNFWWAISQVTYIQSELTSINIFFTHNERTIHLGLMVFLLALIYGIGVFPVDKNANLSDIWGLEFNSDVVNIFLPSQGNFSCCYNSLWWFSWRFGLTKIFRRTSYESGLFYLEKVFVGKFIFTCVSDGLFSRITSYFNAIY